MKKKEEIGFKALENYLKGKVEGSIFNKKYGIISYNAILNGFKAEYWLEYTDEKERFGFIITYNVKNEKLVNRKRMLKIEYNNPSKKNDDKSIDALYDSIREVKEHLS